MSSWKERREAEQKAEQAKKAEKEATLADIEKDFDDAIKETRQKFIEAVDKEKANRHSDAMDANYYFCVYFSNYAQLKEFCEKFGLDSDEIYMDGRDFAKKVGKALQTPDSKFLREKPINRDYASRALDR